MPFRSKKQRSYLKREKPKVYRKWKRKYGTRIVPNRSKAAKKAWKTRRRKYGKNGLTKGGKRRIIRANKS